MLSDYWVIEQGKDAAPMIAAQWTETASLFGAKAILSFEVRNKKAYSKG
jgi:hypothetical protein